ncbi:ImmA/IrrE family metallo-endopeptidase [Lysinibacillus sp. FSL W8-0992]|uniref:ImmA/IrrE family metallo-endopeptidase n=1 Tax=Lysinibacillus sp. FSL W8-0992 TaxID=2954643 RepID=UPI0030F7CAAF
MLPSKVKVGAIDYSVKEVEQVIIDGDIKFAGSCDESYCRIEVKADLPENGKKGTLIHELTHAIFYEAGYQEHSEKMVNRIGKVLHQVLKDNDFSFLKS